ncbi:hypothetical protein Aph02nite_44520 [Actinoplanes philippinensis]|uniref:Barstar (Barnase inhibitor) n=1 Tax=Actinoplanes philippinensis TaxID=35752 RepID=A0A1I2ICE0_9ACTN|nr:barstar family protein [Actinoplanes philippinensis]GIE78502.1 hypothetical protein Aph02nite_44520 [Actinoplanes philippinensis]SFF38516.1 Barstar (barnase inhibitor) [Actinoplanes philippinensis]
MPIPLRWRLLDIESGETVTECSDIDGLFTDRVFPAPPVYEHYTLVGCRPTGPLRAAIDGTGPDWLGILVVEPVHVPGRPADEPCDPGACHECGFSVEELLDVRLVGHRPAADGSDRLDVDLTGHRFDGHNNRHGTTAPEAFGYRLLVTGIDDRADERAGDCGDITGLFRQRADPWPPGPPVTLLGCRPGPTGSIEAELAHVRTDGTVSSMPGEHNVRGKIVATRPSAHGDGLVDLTLDGPIMEPLAGVDRALWDMWRSGGPTRPHLWAALDRGGRRRWVRAAALHRSHEPDKPAGTVYHLDGRHVTDEDAFYCALGEAINGPGGWFGTDLFWVHECATGDGGATPGFRLIWHDSSVARAHLVPGYDRFTWRAALTFDYLVQFLIEEGVKVELR